MSFMLEDVAQDIRFAWRRLRRAPAFTAIAVLTLALGVGVNAAFFSIVNGVIFRSLEVPRPDRLVSLARTTNGRADSDGGQSEGRLERFLARKPALIHGAFAVRNLSVSFEHGDRTSVAMAEAVTDQYFATLGVRPLAGRLLVSGDDRAGANGPVVLSARVWRRDFNQDASIVGQTIAVTGIRLTVVGVAPDGFRGMTIPNLLGADLWMPINSVRPLLERHGRSADGLVFGAFARLTDAATLRRADAEARAISGNIDPRNPELGVGILPASKALMPSPLANIQAALGTALIAISGLVLFVACANLSGLMLTRILSRTSEIATRVSLGAEWRHVLQMQLAEAGIISALAALAGFGAAWGLTRLVARLPVPEIGGFIMAVDATPDFKVFGFAMLAAAIATLMVGWAPAQRAAAIEPLQAWAKSGGTGGATARFETPTSRLVMWQISVSLSLLLVAMLFVRGAAAAAGYDTGVDLRMFTAGRINLAMQNLTDAAGRELLDRLAAVAPAEGAGRFVLTTGVPIAGDGRLELTMSDGQLRRLPAHTLIASPGLFSMLSIQIQQGRQLSDNDALGAPSVAVVSEAMAADMWPGRNPIGRSLRMLSMRDAPVVTIVGVAALTDRSASAPEDRRYVFLPLKQHYAPQIMLLTAGAAGAPSRERLTQFMHANATGVPLFDIQPLTSAIGLKATGARFAAAVVGCVGFIGMAITMVGLYGTVAFLVGERRHEFGIMRALGADPRDIRRLVLRGATRMLVRGIIPGLVLTFLCAGMLRTYLLGLPPYDPVTFIVVPSVMFAIGILAAWIPAQRAARVNPIEAIRSR